MVLSISITLENPRELKVITPVGSLPRVFLGFLGWSCLMKPRLPRFLYPQAWVFPHDTKRSWHSRMLVKG
jgi:hypothetical protein